MLIDEYIDKRGIIGHSEMYLLINPFTAAYLLHLSLITDHSETSLFVQ